LILLIVSLKVAEGAVGDADHVALLEAEAAGGLGLLLLRHEDLLDLARGERRRLLAGISRHEPVTPGGLYHFRPPPFPIPSFL
jgi:hypothetical protein